MTPAQHMTNARYFSDQIAKKPQQRKELIAAVIASLKAALKG